jgi:hypothetical protein
MKSRKIWRLEFVSDKIKGGDCKREDVCTHFGHPTKKNELVWGSPWEGAAKAGVGAPWPAMVSAPEKKGKGERGRNWGGVAWGEGGGGGAMRGCRRGGLAPAAALVALCCYVLCCSWVLYVRKKAARRMKEKGEEKEKEGKEKKRKGRKYGKKFQTWKLFGRKIKDNWWNW